MVIGDKLDRRYQLKREVARGHRSTIYQAQHLFTLRTVALKMLSREAGRQQAERDALRAEARLLSEIHHPCIIEVIDAGELRGVAPGAPGRPYLVMEMLDGRPLAGLLASRGTLEVEDVVHLGMALCSALSAMHDSRVTHLALSPRHLVLSPAGPAATPLWPGACAPPVKVIDFGAAAAAIVAADEQAGGSMHGGAEADYAAPEQLAHQGADERSDIYALGVVLYECLTGQLPHPATPDGASAESIAPPNALRAEVPAAVGAAVMGALGSDPAERYPSTQAFGEALHQAVHRTPAPPRSAPPARRRRTPRACYLTPVRVQRSGGASLDASSEDISRGGMLLVGPQRLDEDELVEVRFVLPISGEVLSVHAIARWQRNARDGRGATGLEFVDLPAEASELIGRYVSFFSTEQDDEPAAR